MSPTKVVVSMSAVLPDFPDFTRQLLADVKALGPRDELSSRYLSDAISEAESSLAEDFVAAFRVLANACLSLSNFGNDVFSGFAKPAPPWLVDIKQLWKQINARPELHPTDTGWTEEVVSTYRFDLCEGDPVRLLLLIHSAQRVAANLGDR